MKERFEASNFPCQVSLQTQEFVPVRVHACVCMCALTHTRVCRCVLIHKHAEVKGGYKAFNFITLGLSSLGIRSLTSLKFEVLAKLPGH